MNADEPQRSQRPTTSFDDGLQHERTALAWERAAIATVVAGLVLCRFAAIHSLWLFAAAGLVQTVFGAGLLVWAGVHYEDLHGPLRAGSDVVHPHAVRLVGTLTMFAAGIGLASAVAVAVFR